MGGWVGGFYIGEQKIDKQWLEDDCLFLKKKIFKTPTGMYWWGGVGGIYVCVRVNEVEGEG